MIKKILLLLFISLSSLAADLLVQVDRGLLQHDPHMLKNQAILQNLYNQRLNQPLWLRGNKIRSQKLGELLNIIDRDITLNTKGYIFKKAQEIKRDIRKKHTQTGLLQLELKLTSLYYNFIQHTIYGEIDWKNFHAKLRSLNQNNKIKADWEQYPLRFDILELLAQDNVTQTIQSITPKGYRYHKLLEALYRLYKVRHNGGWGVLPAFKTLKMGNSSAIVPKLRRRLSLSGDYKNCTSKGGNYFDSCLNKAVKRFQRRHGLTPDGAVGRGTQRLLNISVEKKIQTVLLNLDRIKWLPRDRSNRYIIVNIPEYMLYFYEYKQERQQLKVIVGDTKHPTPVFSNKISYIVLNPYWKVPEGIVKREIIPKMIKNSNYIKRQGLEAHTSWEENSSVVSLQNINWHKYLAEGVTFPYKLMQPPGPRNALGKIKFKFPNKFAVYLHDTPTKHLFKKKRRAFSHGCVRLSNPLSLLKSIEAQNPSIDPTRVKTTLAGKQKRQITIDNKIPINLVYLTAKVNANNELVFGDDIYNYDKYQRRIIR